MRFRVPKSARDGEPVTVGEGAAVAGVVTTIAYAFRWLIGLEGRMNARDLVDIERNKRIDEILISIRDELRAIRRKRNHSVSDDD
jgi:hypothetical protein